MTRFALYFVGVALFCVGIALGTRPSSPAPGELQATGVVIRQDQVRSTYGSYTVPVIRFTPRDGGPVTITLGEPDSMRVGQHVTVNYEPEDPERAWSIPSTVVNPVGVGLVILGVVTIMRGIRRRSA